MRKELWNCNPYLKAAPAQYINEPGILAESGKHISQWGKRALVSGGRRALHAVESLLFPSMDRYEIRWSRHTFVGECSDTNICAIERKIREVGADVLVGVGGGKSLDSAKAAAELAGIPIVTIPTIAATCAAASPTSITYNDGGQYQRDYYMSTNPQLVLVDPEVIANAPLEYLQSGIFDSFAKWYEGRAIIDGLKEPNVFSSLVVCLAGFLNERMTRQALPAVNLVKSKQVGKPLIDVIDLNIYVASAIQSLGYPSFTGAAAHAVHNGLTMLEESHHLLHGIKVGYGIIVMLYLQEKKKAEIRSVVSLFREIGLEPSFQGLQLPFTANNVEKVAERAASDGIMQKMAFLVSKEMVIQSMEQVERDISGLHVK